MSLLGRAVSGFRGERRDLTGVVPIFGDYSILPNSQVTGQTPMGPNSIVNEQSALAISTVFNCVKVLSQDIAILPFRAMQGQRGGYHEPIAAQPQIVVDPFGPDIPLEVGLSQLVVSLSLRGNAYLFITQRDRMGFPTGLMILHPDHVRVQLDKKTNAKYYEIQGNRYETDQVVHLIGMSTPGSLIGLDPISYARQTLMGAMSRVQFANSLFTNGGQPAGVIQVPGPGDRKKARQVKEAWESSHSGLMNAHRPAVLFGDAKWQPLGLEPEAMQFLATRQFDREEIAGLFGVPLHRIQAIADHASAGGGKGLDSMEQGYATHTLAPITKVVEGAWNRMIPGGYGTFTEFDFSGLLRASALERAQIAQIDRIIGRRNRDELRAEEGWAPIGGPDGTDYNIPLNSNTSVPPLADPNAAPVTETDPQSTPGGGQA